MAHLALLEKGVAFEYIMTYPDQSPGQLAKTPRGKVPFIETDGGCINEANVIMEHLEDTNQGLSLLPKDPIQKAYVRSLMKEIELYIELPARSCYPEAMFGVPLPDAFKAKAQGELLAGIATLKRHAKFAPYVAGDTMTLADIVFLYSAELAADVAKKLFDVDVWADFPAAADLLKRLGERPHVQTIAAERAANWPLFIAAVRAKYQGK